MLGERISNFKCIHMAFYNTLCVESTSVWTQLVMRELNVYTRNIIYICIVLEPTKKNTLTFLLPTHKHLHHLGPIAVQI